MLFLFLLSLSSAVLSSSVKHEQVVLSFHGNTSTMHVTWISLNDLDNGDVPFVSYGSDSSSLYMRANAHITKWTDGGPEKISRNTYRAKMVGLTPGKRYFYKVGSSGSTFSDRFTFMNLDATWPTLKVGVYSDLGLTHDYSFGTLISAAQQGQFDIVFHVGDIAYDLESDNGRRGDNFMNAIQNMTAFVPWMVVAGSHEAGQNYNHYINRFTMPSNGIYDDNQFWSFTLGDTHFIGLSTEYYGSGMKTHAQDQYNWLLNDLKKHKAPWTVAFMHRPMYCSNDSPHGCQNYEDKMTRDGEPGLPALEPLFNLGGIDMVFWGHMNAYERNWPVYKSVVYRQGQSENYYHNSATPVYIMSVAGGTHDHEFAATYKQPYTNVVIGDYGYSKLHIISTTQIQTSFITGVRETTKDPFTLTKDYNYKPGQNLNITL